MPAAPRDGKRLVVAEAKFGLADKPAEGPDTGCINDDPDGTDEYNGGHEFWLLKGDEAPRLLLKLCNDGYGAAGMGEDEVKVFPNGIQHFQAGGSNWRWESTKTIRLSPLAVTRELACSYNTVGAGTGQILDIDRETLRVRAVGYVTRDKWSDDQMECRTGRRRRTGFSRAGRNSPAPIRSSCPSATTQSRCRTASRWETAPWNSQPTSCTGSWSARQNRRRRTRAATLRVIQETATTFGCRSTTRRRRRPKARRPASP